VSTADEGASGAVRFGGDAAGIHHNHVGGGWMTFVEPRCAQPAADRLAIGARCPASEMFHMKFRHIPSLVPLPNRAAQARSPASSAANYNHPEGERTNGMSCEMQSY